MEKESRNNHPELDEDLGEMICDKCNGSGSCNTKYSQETSPYYVRCPKCKGRGKVDWVENIIGKKSKCNIIINGEFSIWYPTKSVDDRWGI